ncbi:hypothetical protein ACE09Y_12195 [Raphidiopsis sp. BLCC-F218]
MSNCLPAASAVVKDDSIPLLAYLIFSCPDGEFDVFFISLRDLAALPM